MAPDEKPGTGRRPKRERRSVLVRLDPAIHDAMATWAADEFRSLNAQIEVALRDALSRVGRLPKKAGPLPKRGRPRVHQHDSPDDDRPDEENRRNDGPGDDGPGDDGPGDDGPGDDGPGDDGPNAGSTGADTGTRDEDR